MLEPVKYAEVDSVDGSPGEQELFSIEEAAFILHLYSLVTVNFWLPRVHFGGGVLCLSQQDGNDVMVE